MKLTTIILFLMVSLALPAAMISFTMTNSFGQPDTNAIKVFPCGPVQADGTVYTTGLPQKVQPNTNGYAQLFLEQNNYLATNQFLGKGYLFRAPLDASSNNIYASAGPSCLISGLNYFVNLVVGSSSNSPVTLNQITNSLGFLPLSPAQVTNAVNGSTLALQTDLQGGVVTVSNAVNSSNSLYATRASSAVSADKIVAPDGSVLMFSGTAWQYDGYFAVDHATSAGTASVASNLLGTVNVSNVVNISSIGAASTNFTMLTSNSLYALTLVQINASSNALVASQNASNAVLGASIASASNALVVSKQPASAILSNLAVVGAWTNTIAAGTNAVLSTNINGQIIYVNVPLQTQLTNGMTPIVFSNASAFFPASSAQALTNGFVDKSITNGFAYVVALTNYYLNSNPSNYVTASITNGLSIPSTNGFVTAAVTNGLATTNWVAQNFETNGTTAKLIASSFAWTNQVAAGTNVTLSTNINGILVYVNASAQIFLTNGLASTNYVNSYADTNGAALAAVMQSGANGSNYSAQLYLASTNYANTNAQALFNSVNVNQFVAATNGLAYGLTSSNLSVIGFVGITGPIYSTNLTWQIANAVNLATNGFVNSSVTNFNLSGYVTGKTTNNSFSTSGSNAIINLIAQYATSPTNGVTGLQATNIASGLITAATNSLWSGATNTFYFNSNPSNFTTFQVVTNLINSATNGLSGGGGGGSTNQQVFFTSTNPFSITAPAAAVAFNTNGCMWINRNGNSNNWLNIITNN